MYSNSIILINLGNNFLFQCLHDVADGNMTVHILVEYTSKDEKDTHHILVVWMKSHLDWTTSVSSKLLNSKKLLLDDYLGTLEQNHTPFDEIAILAFARMYHCHIAILMAGRYWCTNKNQDFRRCSIFLLLYGHLEF